MTATTISTSLDEPVLNTSLTVSVGRNMLFGIVAGVAQVATRFVMVPIAIAHLGFGGYGIWSIVLLVATYMQFGAVGIKSAFQKYVAEATGSGNYALTNQLLSTGAAAILAISVAGLIPVAIFSRTLARVAGVPPEFLRSSASAISMLALVMMFSNAGAAYEAIISGGHRVDIIQKLSIGLCILEATGIILVLHFGYGIFAMAGVMAGSGLLYASACYVFSRRVVPQIRLGFRHVTKTVGRELLRFAGSYQIVNVLAIVYQAIAPIAILRAYGATPEGVLAVGTRLVSPVQTCVYAFVVPILSGSAMVYASGSAERMRNLLAKSFKVALYLTVLPLGLISAFGTYLIAAWVGQTDPRFQASLVLLSSAVLFNSFSVLGLVLYRASGKALMDIIREGLRITTILCVLFLAKRLGFLGVLGGIALADLVGATFMMCALTKIYRSFDLKGLLHESLKICFATVGIIAVGMLAAHIPIPLETDLRIAAATRISEICLAILICSYPILHFTGALTQEDVRMILSVFKKRVIASASSVI